MYPSSQKSMKTAKGTELPLLNLKGKDYLQVMHRLVWFREEKPDWSVQTTIIERTPEYVIFRAVIGNGQAIVATAHKREDAKHFPDYLEKAETGAVGRALAMIGYGTQFAPELDEEDRIVDSPVPARGVQQAGPGLGAPPARRPIGPPPQGVRQGTTQKPAAAPSATTRGTGRPAPKTASPSEKNPPEQGDFASFPGGPVHN